MAITTPPPVPDGQECANCHGHGNMACKGCLLVTYCGRDCQAVHWKEHKKYCKSPMMKENWQPGWVTERRTPTFVSDDWIIGSTIRKKYFWGNLPALDTIHLASNEGSTYKNGLRLLFAASGDLRNVMKSMISLPEQYHGCTTWVMNDRDFEIVARNIIISLVALTAPEKEAVDCMLHIWYSTLITQSHADLISGKVRPLINDVVGKISGKGVDTFQAKTWTFGFSSCRVQLLKKDWDLLLTYLDSPAGLSAAQALQIRNQSTLTHHYQDRRDRRIFAQTPAHRVASERFREDGLFLPFGSDREKFKVPNPTFFQTAAWPMKSDAEPIGGWSLPEVLAHSPGAATNDLYGKLFYQIRAVLSKFHRRINSHPTVLRFLNFDAIDFSKHFDDDEKFDRIEVSNVSDGGYLGVHRTLAFTAPLLQPPSVNPHATLIMLFMNAVEEMVHLEDNHADRKEELKRLAKYSPMKTKMTSLFDPSFMLMGASAIIFRDSDKYFKRYMEELHFQGSIDGSRILVPHGMTIKEPHTIVDKWPLRLKLKFGQPGAQEEFDILQSSEHSGTERYMEWKRSGG